MGFLSPALTAVATGAVEQMDENMDQTQAMQNELIKSRQGVVDKVSADQQKINDRANDIGDLSNSYQSLYGVNPDLAYSLATNPAVKSMKPNELADYINTLKPTNGTIPARPQQPGQLIAPGSHRDASLTGNIESALSPGSAGLDSQEIRGPSQPATPQRTIYASQPGLSNEDRIRESKAYTTALAARHDGASADAAGHIYIDAGGDPVKAHSINFSAMPTKFQQDPAEVRDANITANYLMSQFSDQLKAMGVTNPSQIAGFAAYVNKNTAMGPEGPMDKNTGDLRNTDNTLQNLSAWISYTSKAHAPAAPSLSPAPTNINAADHPLVKTDATPNIIASPQNSSATSSKLIEYWPHTNPHKQGMSTAEYNTQNAYVLNTSGAIANINFAAALASNDPDAIGVAAAVVKHVGGPLSNIASFINQHAGATLNDYLKVGQRQGIATTQTALQMSLQRYLMGMNTPTGSSGSMNSGGQELNEMFSEAFRTGDITTTFQGLKNSQADIKQMLLNKYVQSYNNTRDIRQDLNTNKFARAGVADNLMHLGLSRADAAVVLKSLMEINSGGGLQTTVPNLNGAQ